MDDNQKKLIQASEAAKAAAAWLAFADELRDFRDYCRREIESFRQLCRKELLGE